MALDPSSSSENSSDSAQTSTPLSGSLESFPEKLSPEFTSSHVEKGDGFAVHVFEHNEMAVEDDLMVENPLHDLVSILGKLQNFEPFKGVECDQIGEDLLFLFAGRPVRGYELSEEIPSDYSAYMPTIKKLVVAPCFARKTGSDWVLAIGRMRFHQTMFVGLLISSSGIDII
mgnify:CR=1 FL=1